MVEQRSTDRGRSRPSRKARTRRSASHGPRTVIPSNRWRPMRRVGGEPEQQEEAAKHGLFGRLFQG